MYTRICTYMHIYMHIYYINTWMIHTHITCACTYVYTYKHEYMYTFIYIYIHTYIYTYIHTWMIHTHIDPKRILSHSRRVTAACAWVYICTHTLKSISEFVYKIDFVRPFWNGLTSSAFYTAPEASWRRGFDPCTPLLIDLFNYLEQNGYFWLVPEHAPGPSSQVLPGWRIRHPCYSKKLFVRCIQDRFR